MRRSSVRPQRFDLLLVGRVRLNVLRVAVAGGGEGEAQVLQFKAGD